MRTFYISRTWRFCALWLALIMMFGMLTACGKNVHVNVNVNGNKETETETETVVHPDSNVETETDDATDNETDSETRPTLVTYTVTVTDGKGRVLPGATVQMCATGENGVCFLPGTTDENGIFTTEKERGSYKVNVTLKGYTSDKEYYYFEENATDLQVDLIREIVDQPYGEVLDAPFADSFTVSNVFSDNMVVQRGEHIRVWGFADESQNGKKVAGTFMDATAEALIENGAWELTFAVRMPACADMGNDMMIYAGAQEVIFHDVLVGDVFMVVGQSNVQISLAEHLLSVKDTPVENNLIRYHYNCQIQNDTSNPANQLAPFTPKGTADECRELPTDSRWMLPTYSNFSGFSALAYYFGLEMLKQTNNQVPVGLIEIAAAGRPIGVFLPNEVADATGADTWSEEKGYYTCPGGHGDGKTHSRFMYNYYMNPFERYAIAGMVWYQGESDCQLTDAQNYITKFSALVNFMRTTHNLVNPDFPVYIMEFPTIYDGSWDYGTVRSIMGAIPNVLENSYMVACSDMATDRYAAPVAQLHPPIKHLQAKRLAAIVASVMGISDKTLAEVSGPILVDAKWGSADMKTVILTFDNVGEGLMTSDGSELVLGFSNTRSTLQPMRFDLEARITAPNQITITCSRRFECVSYNAFADFFYGKELNLCNSYGQIATATSFVVTAYAEGVEV